MIMIKKGLGPIYNNKTETLILGSFPGEESLKKGKYYANEKNQFWKIMFQVLNEDFTTSLSYEERKEMLFKNKIGLWDLFYSCERDGSTDKKIRNEKSNDFSKLKEATPNLKLIFLNGGRTIKKKWKKYYSKLEELELRIESAYSTSPQCNRWKSERLSEWKNLLKINKGMDRIRGTKNI